MTIPSVVLHPGELSRANRYRHHEQNPDRPADQRHPFHTHQVGNRKFHSDRKHQQNDADFGKHLERVQVREMRAWRERADDDPAQNKANDQRQPKAPCHESPDDGGQKYVSQIAKENRIGFHFYLSRLRSSQTPKSSVPNKKVKARPAVICAGRAVWS